MQVVLGHHQLCLHGVDHGVDDRAGHHIRMQVVLGHHQLCLHGVDELAGHHIRVQVVINLPFFRLIFLAQKIAQVSEFT